MVIEGARGARGGWGGSGSEQARPQPQQGGVARHGIEPTTPWILVWFVPTEPRWERCGSVFVTAGLPVGTLKGRGRSWWLHDPPRGRMVPILLNCLAERVQSRTTPGFCLKRDTLDVLIMSKF